MLKSLDIVQLSHYVSALSNPELNTRVNTSFMVLINGNDRAKVSYFLYRRQSKI